LERPDQRAAMGQAGARRARERYRWKAVASATERVYRSVVDRPAATLTSRR
jgi:glycosyltransferase involved in cell wall biosynthesis